MLALGITATISWSAAQGPGVFNEREVKSSGTLGDDPKSGNWTLDFHFKDPRLIKVNVPGRGTRICWYLWYKVINYTREPRTFFPEFELVTLDFPGSYMDETLTTVEDAIRKLEDPTGYQDLKNTVNISASPIPVSLPPGKAFPKIVYGLAIWDGSPADARGRDEKLRDISDSQRFSIYVSGLSNEWVKVDPLAKGKADQPVIQRKTLQLNFKRAGDRFSLDSRDIAFEPPAQWVYRSAKLPKLKLEEAIPGKDGKKDGQALNHELENIPQPVIHQGKSNGS
jgi:hypothetical protein